MQFIRNFENTTILDSTVAAINTIVAPQINCLDCGNCCKSLMVNITQQECEDISTRLNTNVTDFKNQHVETSAEGTYMILNKMPCTFLQSNNACSIYNNRFTECRAFPQLNVPDFKSRTFSTMMHFDRCPIIFNVIQQLKVTLGFINKPNL